jgi:flagellar biosynthetic protein FlhB
MSEDRTQPPSKRRRQLAREQGQAAHSPELTAAAGWLAAVGVLWFCGGGLASGLIGLIRGALSEWDPGAMPADAAGAAARVRGMAMALAWPLGALVAAFAPVRRLPISCRCGACGRAG